MTNARDDVSQDEIGNGNDPPRRVEIAVLCAIAAGVSADEIAAGLGQVTALDRQDVVRLIAVLRERGYLRESVVGDRMAYVPTARGRRLIVDHLGAWPTAADELDEERRQVERLRTDLLSTISHELRTPLTLIRTSIGLLLDSDADAEMWQRLLRNIRLSSERMHLLVTDLLDLARLRGERFELQVRNVDIGELVTGAVSLLRPLLDEKGQRVDIAAPNPAPVVPGDYRRLERVLLNLLGNANKFAAAESKIDITVTMAEHEVTVAVRDYGPGIPEEAMPHLFDQFFTARTSSSRHNIGAGLGLPIAKGIVAAHGGRIWVESALGAGTSVSFALPRRWPPEKAC
jgi:signal transduction histidine kinase